MTLTIVRYRNRIHRFLEFHGIETPFKGKWNRKTFHALRELPLSSPLQTSLNILLTMLDELWSHQTTLREQLRELCRKERYTKDFSIARSAPGIGWFTAIRLVLELGNLSRFTSGKKIASFLGLTPGEYSTGETTRKGAITGMGSGFLRAALIENSWVAVRKDPVLLTKFMRIWHGSGSKKKAIVAVARILIVRLRACMVSGTVYTTGIAR